MSEDNELPDDVTVIKAPEILKKKALEATGGAGLSRADIAVAQTAIDSMAESYLEHAVIDVQNLRDTFGRLTSSSDAAAIEVVYDISHDIKGQGGSFGYGLMTGVAGGLCNFLEDKTTISAIELNVVKVHIDTLALVLGNKITGDGGDQGRQLLAGLDLLIAKMTAGN